MEYMKKIKISDEMKTGLKALLETEPETESDCFGEDESITYSATFQDGCRMCVDICGVQYEEGSSNLPYTQAVLYDQTGNQLSYTEPSDGIDGPWELEANGNTYVAVVC